MRIPGLPALLLCLVLPVQAALAQAALAQAAVGVRSGEHAEFSRLVFDWTEAVGYRVEQDGDQVSLTFDNPRPIDLSAIQRRLPSRLRAIESRPEGGKSAVRLRLAAGNRIKHFRSGTKVVVDISAQSQAAAFKAEPKPKQAAKPAPAPAVKPAPQPKQNARPAPATGNAAPGDRHALIQQAIEAVVAEPRPEAVPQIGIPDPPPARQSAGLSGQSGTWSRSEPMVFLLNTGSGAGAAAFRRGGHLWLAFDKVLPQGFAKNLEAREPDLGKVEYIPLARASILRLELPPAVVPRLQPTAGGWQVTLDKGVMRPEREPEIVTQSSPSPRLLYRIPDEGRMLRVVDPDLGDYVAILPVLEAGLGQRDARRYPEFESLATSQGFVIVPRYDNLRVGLSLEGLSVITEDGLLVTTENDLPKLADPEIAVAGPARLFDLPAWRISDEDDFDKNRQALQAASAKEGEGAIESRLALARFFFAHGLAAETLSALRDLEGVTDPRLNPLELMLMQGASHFQRQEYEKASLILTDPSLTGQPDAVLWLAALAAEERDWPRAAELFQETESLIDDYIRRWRADLRLLAAESRLGVGDTGGASLYLGAVHDDEPNDIQKAKLDLLDARRFIADGRVNAAFTILERLKFDPHRPTQAEARLVLVEQRFKSGEVDRAGIIDELESLRFLWRGDDFELDLLDRLATLYSEIGDYRTALHRLRQLASREPGTRRSNAAAQRMRKLFAEIFDPETGPPVPPLKAVAFYEEFKELTPLGRTGAQLIQSLARQLVEVELPDRAAEMLEETITPRLRGNDRADLGRQLAEVYLRNQSPEDALAALERTRVDRTDPVLALDRRHLQAKALADLGRYDQALALLDKDKSKAGMQLLSEIAWATRDWPRAALALAALIPAEPPQDRALTSTESRLVLNLAIAHTMAQDRQALDTLKGRFRNAMATGPDGESFALLTSDFSQLDATAIMRELKDVDTVDSFIASYRSGGNSAARDTTN